MIELINHGVHYANGAIIDGSEAEQMAALQAKGLSDKDPGRCASRCRGPGR